MRPRQINRSRSTLVRAAGGKTLELALHGVDLCEIAGDEVIAAALAIRELKAAARIAESRARATEVDDGGEILLLLRIGLGIRHPREHEGDLTIEIHRCKLDRVAWEHANIGAEPAILVHDSVVSDAIPGHFCISGISGLVQPDGA